MAVELKREKKNIPLVCGETLNMAVHGSCFLSLLIWVLIVFNSLQIHPRKGKFLAAKAQEMGLPV